MEGLLAQLSCGLKALPQESTALQTLMSQIESEINTHFACEEQALFPAVSPYHPMVLMEAEHEMLIALRDELLKCLHPFDPSSTAAVQDVGARFIQEMRDHIAREDGGIFPACEQALSESEKQTVLAGMTAIRETALQAPTPSISRPSRGIQCSVVDLQSEASRAIFSERLFEDPEVKHLVIRGGDALAAHWSPRRFTLICLKGAASLEADGQTIALDSGVSVVISAQLQHAVSARSDCHLLLVFG